MVIFLFWKSSHIRKKWTYHQTDVDSFIIIWHFWYMHLMLFFQRVLSPTVILLLRHSRCTVLKGSQSFLLSLCLACLPICLYRSLEEVFGGVLDMCPGIPLGTIYTPSSPSSNPAKLILFCFAFSKLILWFPFYKWNRPSKTFISSLHTSFLATNQGRPDGKYFFWWVYCHIPNCGKKRGEC